MTDQAVLFIGSSIVGNSLVRLMLMVMLISFKWHAGLFKSTASGLIYLRWGSVEWTVKVGGFGSGKINAADATDGCCVSTTENNAISSVWQMSDTYFVIWKKKWSIGLMCHLLSAKGKRTFWNGTHSILYYFF